MSEKDQDKRDEIDRERGIENRFEDATNEALDYPWSVLQLRETSDLRAIKSAYARKLKSTRPDDDPEAYQELRSAYEYAQYLARVGLSEAEEAAPAIAFTAAEATATETEAMDTAPRAPDEPSLTNQERGRLRVSDVPPMASSNDDLFAARTSTAEAEPDHRASDTTQSEERILTPESVLCDFGILRAEIEKLPVAAAHARLTQFLDGFPVGARPWLSRIFAEWIVSQEVASPVIVDALSEFFEWRTDYRTEHILGADLAYKVRNRVAWVLDHVPAPGEVDAQRDAWNEVRMITLAIANGKTFLASLLAFWASFAATDLLRLFQKSKLSDESIPEHVVRRANSVADFALIVRSVLSALTIFILAALLTAQSHTHVLWVLFGGAMLVGGFYVVFVNIDLFFTAHFRPLLRKIFRLSEDARLDTSPLFVLLPLMLGIVVLAFAHLNMLPSIGPSDTRTAPWIAETLGICAIVCFMTLMTTEEMPPVFLAIVVITVSFCADAAAATSIHNFATIAIGICLVASARSDQLIANERTGWVFAARVLRVMFAVLAIQLVGGKAQVEMALLVIGGYFGLSYVLQWLSGLRSLTFFALMWAAWSMSLVIAPSALARWTVIVFIVCCAALWVLLELRLNVRQLIWKRVLRQGEP
jgi:hypothetical protein